jgi:LacI family transcriptional regulator
LAKSTIQDVAQLAGVSVSTVDRALHGRGSVSSDAKQRISEAIRATGFGTMREVLPIATRPVLRARFLLPHGTNGFVNHLKSALKSACARVGHVDLRVDIQAMRQGRLSEFPVKDLVRRMDAARKEDVDIIGIFSADTPQVRDAIDRCATAGVSVVTLVSDVPSSNRFAYIGIDNSAAGRTAARLMGKFIPEQTGTIAVITGSMSIRDHMERFFGFRETILKHFRHLTVLPVIETNSIESTNLKAIKTVAQAHDNLRGIYMITGGVTGLLTGIRETQFARRPAFIAHDLSPVNRRALISGELDAVIHQCPERIASITVRRMLESVDLAEGLQDEFLMTVPVEIYVAENL